MTFDWQIIVVFIIVAAAALYLGRRIWLAVMGRSAGGCGKCSTCPTNSPAAPPSKQLVSLDEDFARQTRR